MEPGRSYRRKDLHAVCCCLMKVAGYRSIHFRRAAMSTVHFEEVSLVQRKPVLMINAICDCSTARSESLTH